MNEIFSDSTRRNFPKDQIDLSARLKTIESCINNAENLREVNVEFCKRAFRLLADCGLITEETVRFLSNAAACQSYDSKLKFPYNKTEGVLRKAKNSDDVFDAKNFQRFYHEITMFVLGLSTNKRAFYNWVALKTQAALKNFE